MWHLTWQGSCHILEVTSLHPSLSPLQMEVMGQIPQAWQLAEVGGSLPLDSDCFSLTLVFGWDTDEFFCCQKKKKKILQLAGWEISLPDLQPSPDR